MIALFTVLVSVVSAMSTYKLAQYSSFNAIRASSTLTILAYGVAVVAHVDAAYWSLVFFGASFVGMSTPQKFGYTSMAVSGACFGCLYLLIAPFINGIGGALGSSAFLAVCVSHVGILLRERNTKRSV
ncbi:hypothetical protein [Alteromonas sp. C1M14]|uniref:hypothetical protein n=1 Tax=Alteromonas sp. C1M14 TaxID=2841567 RepID=UPI001C07F895|nr:hypothetical protein [Alteromonas sp. C1M14]MBU2978228.1 hypothetical protein [Alteromonas sp. C1M14]